MKRKLYHTEHNYTVPRCLLCKKKLYISKLETCTTLPVPPYKSENATVINRLAKKCKTKKHFVYIIGKYKSAACSEKCALFLVFQNIG